MGTITVNVSNETETLFRTTVKKEQGSGKGVLGRALDEAMKQWAEEREQEIIRKRLIARMRKGLHIGWKGYKKRSELYDERIRKLLPH